MSPGSPTWGLAGVALALATLVSSVARRRPYLAFASGLALGLVPIEGLAVAGYVRGLTGDLSITTLVLLGALGVGRLGGARGPARRELEAIFLVVLVLTVWLYPLSLGVGPWDVYALGYAPAGLLVGLAVPALVAWAHELRLALFCLLASVLTYAIGLYESQNLWDYLLDPWLALFAPFWLIASTRKDPAVSQELVKPGSGGTS